MSHRSCTHGKNISVDTSDACCSTLERLNCTRVVVRLDLENTSQASAHINHTCILLTGLYQHLLTLLRESFKILYRVFVRSMLAPHHRVNTQLCIIWRSSSEILFDFLKLFGKQSQLLSCFNCYDLIVCHRLKFLPCKGTIFI